MTKARRNATAVGLCVLALVALPLTGCVPKPGDNPRLTAEEAGYLDAHQDGRSNVAAQARLLQTHATALRNSQPDQQRIQAEHGLRAAVAGLQAAAKKHLPALTTTHPPVALVPLHARLVELLATAARVEDGVGSEALGRALAVRCEAFLAASGEFDAAVAGRSSGASDGSGDWVVKFKPSGLPVGIDSNGQFFVEPSVTTPLGEVSVERTQKFKGATRLIIEYEGKRRYLRLDRASSFQVSVPKGFALAVSTGSDTVTVTVMSR